jgi:hypothetical protein
MAIEPDRPVWNVFFIISMFITIFIVMVNILFSALLDYLNDLMPPKSWGPEVI